MYLWVFFDISGLDVIFHVNFETLVYLEAIEHSKIAKFEFEVDFR